MVTIVEVMGRNAGWLTAAAQLAIEKGQGPDLMYLPEKVFDYDEFFEDIEKIINKKGKAIVVISEGVKDAEGKYIPEHFGNLFTDSFGHAQLGGAAEILAREVEKRFDIKVRGIEFSLMQRCAQHLASKVDVTEAYQAGVEAVKAAVNGATDVMIGFERVSNKPYKINYIHVPLHKVANTEKKVPLEWIKPHGKGMTQEYVEYVLPLIQGDCKAPLEDGLPRFAKLKKVLVKK